MMRPSVVDPEPPGASGTIMVIVRSGIGLRAGGKSGGKAQSGGRPRQPVQSWFPPSASDRRLLCQRIFPLQRAKRALRRYSRALPADFESWFHLLRQCCPIPSCEQPMPYRRTEKVARRLAARHAAIIARRGMRPAKAAWRRCRSRRWRNAPAIAAGTVYRYFPGKDRSGHGAACGNLRA